MLLFRYPGGFSDLLTALYIYIHTAISWGAQALGHLHDVTTMI